MGNNEGRFQKETAVVSFYKRGGGGGVFKSSCGFSLTRGFLKPASDNLSVRSDDLAC
ncbi:MAG: hypothetical protein U5L10_02135 [Candidatus Moranbacteria bacterium]|nr:hypothetical protein [Candidatus Moranbacteria bacterium]